MLVPTDRLLLTARHGGYAVGAFDVYTLEGIQTIATPAEALRSPAFLQVLPRALSPVGNPLIAACLEAARGVDIPMAVHLDHYTAADTIAAALVAGISSVMADGSHLPIDANPTFTRRMVQMAAAQGATVEGELGRLAGSEDGHLGDIAPMKRRMMAQRMVA